MITSYNELTLGRYLDIIAASKDDGLDELDKNARILSVLTGHTEQELIDTDIIEFRGLIAQGEFLTETPKPAKKLRNMYRVGEWTLIPTPDAFHLTAGQYIDFQSLVNGDDRLLQLCSVLLVPQGKTYGNGYDVGEVKKAIADNLSVKDAVTVVAFFLGSSRKSTAFTLHCLAVRLKRMKRTAKNEQEVQALEKAISEMKNILDSLQGGDGSQR